MSLREIFYDRGSLSVEAKRSWSAALQDTAMTVPKYSKRLGVSFSIVMSAVLAMPAHGQLIDNNVSVSVSDLP